MMMIKNEWSYNSMMAEIKNECSCPYLHGMQDNFTFYLLLLQLPDFTVPTQELVQYDDICIIIVYCSGSFM